MQLVPCPDGGKCGSKNHRPNGHRYRGRCGSRTHRTNSKAFYECLRLMSKEEAQKPPKQALALVSNKDSDLNSLEFDGPGILRTVNMARCT